MDFPLWSDFHLFWSPAPQRWTRLYVVGLSHSLNVGSPILKCCSTEMDSPVCSGSISLSKLILTYSEVLLHRDGLVHCQLMDFPLWSYFHLFWSPAPQRWTRLSVVGWSHSLNVGSPILKCCSTEMDSPVCSGSISLSKLILTYSEVLLHGDGLARLQWICLTLETYSHLLYSEVLLHKDGLVCL